MNLQPSGTSHTTPSNCLCHSWTYNRQVQVTQSTQLPVSLMNLQPSGTSHIIHPDVYVTHEPTTVRYKSHNPSNCLCHSWTYNRQVQVTQSIQLPVSLMNVQPSGTSHTIHPDVCHSWTYNHQVQVTQSIQLLVPPMNLQPSDTSHTIHPTVCVTHEPTTVRYKSHNPFNCLCHSWTYNHQVTQSIQLPVSLMNHQVQVTQSIQMYMSLMNLQLLGTSHTIHSTACVTHEPTTVRYKSHNPFNCLCHSWTYNHQVQVIQSIQMYVTHEPTTVRYKSHNPFNCLCHSWTYNH